MVFGPVFAGAEHLVFNRVTTSPRAAEFVSIYNPTSEPIDLSDYYITDSNNYYNLATDNNFWILNPFNFIARFPDNQIIDSHDFLVVGLHNAQMFSDYYGYSPDITLFEDMRDAINGVTTISAGDNFASTVDLLSNPEMLMLFKWEQGSDIVQDVDYFVWGFAQALSRYLCGAAVFK